MENAFGILAARWLILANRINTDTELAVKIAKGCVCLHNYLISSEGDGASAYNPPNMVDREAEDGEVVPGQCRELLRGKVFGCLCLRVVEIIFG